MSVSEMGGSQGRGLESCPYEAQIIGTPGTWRAETPPRPARAPDKETLMAVLADADIQARLAERSGWTCEGGTLVKKFELEDFMAVVDLVNAWSMPWRPRPRKPIAFIPKYHWFPFLT